MKLDFPNRILYSIAFVLICQSSVFAQSDLDTQWKKWTDTTLPDTTRIKALHVYSQQKYLNSNPDSAYYFSQIAFDFAEQHNLTKHKGKALRTKARALYRQGNYKQALQAYEASLEVFKDIDDQNGISNVFNGIGLTYRRMGNDPKAVNYHYMSLKIKEALGDRKGIIRVLNNIGIIHYNNDNYDEAINFYSRGLSIAEELGDDPMTSLLLNNLANVYDYTDKDSLAINYYERSLALNEKRGDSVGIARTLTNIAIIYENSQREKAMSYYFKSLEIRKRLGWKNEIAMALNNIGVAYYYAYHNGEQSIVYCKQALAIAQEINEKRTISNAAGILYYSYKALGKNKEALAMLELKGATELEIKADEGKDELFRQEQLYKFEKKELQLKAEQEIQQEQLRSRNTLVAIVSIFLLVVIGFAINIFFNLKKQKTLTSEIEKSNANKQRLFGIVAHDLVNPFNAILGYTQLLEDDYDNFTEEERKQFIGIINKYANSNYNLTKTLLDWSKSQQKRMVVDKVKLNYKTMVENAIEPYLVLADKKQISVNTSIPNTIFIEADKNMMQTVISNLFVNAVKYTPEKGTVTFHLNENEDNTVNLEVVDTGIGMTEEQLNNLFDITKTNTTRGTDRKSVV